MLTAIGSAIARGGKVTAELFDGIADSAEEAKEMAFEVNRLRDKAKFEAAAKMGPMGIMGLR